MSAAVALQEQIEVNSQLQVADGYTMAVRRQAQARRAPLRALLVDLRKMLNSLLRTFDGTTPSLRTLLEEKQDECSEQQLQSLLWRLQNNVEGLRKIVAYRRPLIQKRRLAAAYWTNAIQDRLLAYVEEYDDLTESLALGMNADFHREVADCRVEAGLTDAVVTS